MITHPKQFDYVSTCENAAKLIIPQILEGLSENKVTIKHKCVELSKFSIFDAEQLGFDGVSFDVLSGVIKSYEPDYILNSSTNKKSSGKVHFEKLDSGLYNISIQLDKEKK